MFGPLHHSSPGSLTPSEPRGGVRDLFARSGVDELAFHVRDGRTAGVERDVVAVERDRVRDRAHLGHAVALADVAVQPVGDGLAERRVERGRTGEDGVHAREVVLIDERMLGQRDGNGRCDEDVRRLLLGDDPQELDEIELRHRDEARAAIERSVEQDRHAVDVEERQDRENLVVGLDAHPRNDLADVGYEVPMGEHDPLGSAGGARGVRQHRELGGRIEGDLGRRCTLAEQITQREVAFGTVEHEHVLGRDTDQVSSGLCLRQERRDGEEELGLGIGELLGDVLGGVERVDRGRDATGTKDAVEDGTEGRGRWANAARPRRRRRVRALRERLQRR